MVSPRHCPCSVDLFLSSPDFKWKLCEKNSNCPPKAGPAKLKYGILLLGGWVPEANYSVRVQTYTGDDGNSYERGRTIFDLRTDFEMRYKDGY